MTYQQPYHMGPFYTQNKSSDNPAASLNLSVHNFSASQKCRRPPLISLARLEMP